MNYETTTHMKIIKEHLPKGKQSARNRLQRWLFSCSWIRRPKKSVKPETPLKNVKETIKELRSSLARDKAAKNWAPRGQESPSKPKSNLLCLLLLSNYPNAFLKVKEPYLKKYSLSNQARLASVPSAAKVVSPKLKLRISAILINFKIKYIKKMERSNHY